MSMVTLFVATRPNASLADALQAFVGREAVGLFYGTAQCCFGRVGAGGAVTGASGKPLGLEAVYEARIFDKEVELRWWNDPTFGQHLAVVLSETALVPAGWSAQQPMIAERIDPPQEYLLWGKRSPHSDDLAAGWTRLTTARIGALEVPAIGAERFVLTSVEYLKEFKDGDSNVAAVEERLVGLETR